MVLVMSVIWSWQNKSNGDFKYKAITAPKSYESSIGRNNKEKRD